MGQNNNFTASVSQQEVHLNQSFTLTFTLIGKGENFKPPSFHNFLVLTGPVQTTSRRLMNGYLVESVAFSYLLQAKATGKLSIGKASIEINGRRVYSNMIGMVATAKQEDEKLLDQIQEQVFITTTLSKTEVYQNEALVIDYKFYTRLSLARFGLKSIPAPDGFWTEDIPLPGPIQLSRQFINGESYDTSELKKSVLFPLRSGSLPIQVMEAQSVVRLPVTKGYKSRDPQAHAVIADGYEEVNYLVRSQPVQIRVRPLPADAPAAFAGAVGSFSRSASIDKATGKENEPISLTISIFGNGNLTLIDSFKLEMPAEIEIYDPTIKDHIDVTENGVSGTRTFEYLLVPKQAGNYSIKPVEFSYFDLEKKEYVAVSSPEYTLKIAKGSPSLAASNFSDYRLQSLLKDFRPIVTDTISLRKRGGYFFGSPLFYSMLAAPIMLFAFFMVYLKKQESLAGSPVLLQNKQVNKMASKRLLEAEKHLKTNNGLLFYEETARALWEYMSGKLGIPVATLSKEAVVIALQERNIPEEVIQQLTTTIDTCEFARYAPQGNLAARESLYEDATQLITCLNKHLT